ncbi:MAG: histidine kinase dimerization/phosphoacceptor domain -containing protein [Candidatus Eremiobacteraeota bacterium]|nr:histidine kinase dimerization/phosphoacceptor domain -containing protein [Candidatus Eremiobacteraeota bacterium]
MFREVVLILKARVAIVDDDDEFVDMLTIMLSTLGHEVVFSVSNGKEALDKMLDHNPDIVLMDIVLSNSLDGIETAGLINSIYKIPVIYMTGHTEDKFLEKAKLTEPFGYMLKPIRSNDLKHALEMGLYRSKVEKELKKYREHLEDLVNLRTHELQEANEKLVLALEEKHLLLRELNHRVKNNMQAISGLLRIQAASSGNKEVAQVLLDFEKRIQAIGLIHGKLQDSGDYMKVRLKPYLTDLAKNIVSTFENWAEVTLNIDISEVQICSEKAMTCGLVLNELISNSLKHAFNGTKKGTITITVKANSDIKIIFSDNGKGLPGDFSLDMLKTTGLHLVKLFVEDQLHGTLKMESKKGLTCTIAFPPEES